MPKLCPQSRQMVAISRQVPLRTREESRPIGHRSGSEYDAPNPSWTGVPVAQMTQIVSTDTDIAHRARIRLSPGRATGARVLALAALAATSSGCGSNLGMPESATIQGDEVVSLWRVFFILAALVAGLIWVLTTMVVVSSWR